jgi:hypothetical protein
MSDEVTFDDVVYHLRHNDDPSVRAEAAQMLGDYVDNLSEDEYDIAANTLNEALTDPDPMVLMAAMTALSHYTRRTGEMQAVSADDDDDDGDIEAVSNTCRVCGRPEVLIDAATCEYDMCPYK